jgi:hypothetical protein
MASVLDLLDRPIRAKRVLRRVHPSNRIARLIEVDPITGCHLWTGRLNNCGYGVMTFTQAGYRTATLSAHKVSYELTNGRVPDGLVIDHLCRVRHCVNPDHMEAVTSRENVMRSPVAQAAINARKTHCPQGHLYTPENMYTVTKAGGRQCRICGSERNASKAVAS